MINYNSIERKKLFLLDMDGTIYLDNKLFEYSLDFLKYIKANEGKYVFLTNNSSKSVKEYLEKLTSLGIPVDETNFLTSSQATSLYLKANYNEKKIYVLGTESFKEELIEDNIIVTDQLEEEIGCLVVGFDTELTYKKLEDACKLLNSGVDFIATNPDLVCPTSFGFIPDCGSICNMLIEATGKTPFYIGKPNATMVDLAIKNSGFKKEEAIMIGDRLYTDIACGINAGITTAVVLTGETKRDDINNTEYKPKFIFNHIGEIYHQLSEIKVAEKI
ncbi:HAD-superfamily subfamily IIA hydrolase, TIGR01457 [Mesobacillus persicus]|uniref:Acid sugar phosphatase n=1 Tax=Mesobacillus persicus TaxID=930146 RepID=A0A1H8GWW1_9BACI|nr:HAD-IIA family hydrolase [Mesobacillus persicus]SEN48552.1 HAD-superfamily subfamily IIA hydrolase, TIGR01457 [Mesobacillus persicus]